MKIYIVGKLAEEDYNCCWHKFQEIEETLVSCGYEVINPMKILPKGIEWENSLDIIKTYLIGADAALFLPDWKDMHGSQMERYWAKRNDIRIVDYENIEAELLKSKV